MMVWLSARVVIIAAWLKSNYEYAIWLGAAGTLGAVLVALFRDEWRRWWWRPHLKVKVSLEPPDCQTLELTGPDGEVLSEAHYFQLRVENRGRGAAENVEVFIQGIERRQEDGKFDKVGSFYPMNLLWAHLNDVRYGRIPASSGRYCTLGRIVDPANAYRSRIADTPDRRRIPADRSYFKLCLWVTPNNRCDLLDIGTYRLTLEVICDGVKSLKQQLEIKLDGSWDPDVMTMIKRRSISYRIA